MSSLRGRGLRDRVAAEVDAAAGDLVDLSHRIHANPETAFEEVRASTWLAARLEAGGFDVELGTYGLPTSFRADAGKSGPRVVLCAEYDALPGIGHACGHNVIGACAVGAGLALAAGAEEAGLRVTVLGTPAEEDLGGKRMLVERGAFEKADACLMVHPAPVDIRQTPGLALADLVVTVRGRASHAALSSGSGGNALRALVGVHVALSEMELTPYERCNGVILHGGEVPNVVPEETSSRWFLRARNLEELESFVARVEEEVERSVAAAGCAVEFSSGFPPYREMKTNSVLAERYEAHVRSLGRELVPQSLIGAESATSTDQGNVSQVVPSIHPMIGIDSGPVLPHQPGFAAAAVTESADRAVLDGAKALAMTALDVAMVDGLLEQVREEFETTDSTGNRVSEQD